MIGTRVSPAELREIFRELPRELRDTTELKRGYGRDIVSRAQHNAAGRPSPQARGIASTLRVSRKGGAVLGLPSATVLLSGRLVKAAGINYGAEYGSSAYRQFAPRRESGYFLNPAADQVTDRAGERYLDEALDSAIKDGRRRA